MINEAINTFQAICLGLIQGLTEFLPISSSGHLALMPLVTSWPDQGLAFDCVVHLGTLTAIVYYFRTDLARMAVGFGQTIQQRSWSANRDGQMAWMIGFATIPAGIFGLALKDFVENELRSVEVIAYASIGFGLLLYVADKFGKQRHSEANWGIKDVMIVGLAQAVALIPGTSRSGITMTAALFLGYTREAAARFSFLLSIPVIFLAGGLKIKDWIELPMQVTPLSALVIGYFASAISAYICVVYFLKFLNRVGMGPFVLYRIILGFVLLWMVW